MILYFLTYNVNALYSAWLLHLACIWLGGNYCSPCMAATVTSTLRQIEWPADPPDGCPLHPSALHTTTDAHYAQSHSKATSLASICSSLTKADHHCSLIRTAGPDRDPLLLCSPLLIQLIQLSLCSVLIRTIPAHIRWPAFACTFSSQATSLSAFRYVLLWPILVSFPSLPALSQHATPVARCTQASQQLFLVVAHTQASVSCSSTDWGHTWTEYPGP